VSAVVRNSGTCGPIIPFSGGQRAWYDGRGSVSGSVSWTETNSVDTVVTEQAGQGSLEWGKAIQLTLPGGVQSIALTIDQLDGKRVIVTGNDMGQKWYTVQSNPGNNYVLISPRALDEAMGN